MAFPTFDGNAAMFGPAPYVVVYPNPSGWQVTAYPGVNGVQATYMGSRGYTAEASGTLFGVGLGDLAAAEAVWVAYKNSGLGFLLTDTEGNAWPGAVLMEYRPAMRILPWDAKAGFGRDFSATFLIPK